MRNKRSVRREVLIVLSIIFEGNAICSLSGPWFSFCHLWKKAVHWTLTFIISFILQAWVKNVSFFRVVWNFYFLWIVKERFYFPETWSDLHRFSILASNRPFYQSKVYCVAMAIIDYEKKTSWEKVMNSRIRTPLYIYSLLKSWLCCSSLAAINEKKLSRIHVPCDKLICFSSCWREANFTPT